MLAHGLYAARSAATHAHLGKRCLAASLSQDIEKVRDCCLQVRPVAKIHVIPGGGIWHQRDHSGV